MHIIKQLTRLSCLMVLVILIISRLTHGQTGPAVFGSAGKKMAIGTNQVHGTVGQAHIGKSSTDSSMNSSGFWFVAAQTVLGDTSPGTLTGIIWKDDNGDGIRDNGEIGVDGMSVRLHDPGLDGVIGGDDDQLVNTVDSEVKGIYSFSDISRGRYYLEFRPPEPPPGFRFSPQNQGDSNKDSDPDPATGFTRVFTLNSGQTDDGWDAGLIQNELPRTTNVSVAVTEKQSVSVNLSEFIHNPDDDLLSYNITSQPLHGTLDTAKLPELKYTHTSSNRDPDSLKFIVNDGLVDSNEATVTIGVKPVFEFTHPETPVNATADDFDVSINWHIGTSEDFKFSLFLNDDLTKKHTVFPLLTFDLDSKLHDTGIQITPDPKRLAPKNIWYPAVQIIDGIYDENVYIHHVPFIISEQNQSRITSIVLSADTIQFGQSIKIEAQIVPSNPSANGESLKGPTTFTFQHTDGVKEVIQKFSSDSGFVKADLTPKLVGDWGIIVKWEGNSTFNESPERSTHFTIEPSPSAIQIFNNSATHIKNQDLTITGRIQLLIPEQASDKDLSGIQIEFNVLDSSDSVLFSTTTTSGIIGSNNLFFDDQFRVTIPGSVFNEDGDFEIQAHTKCEDCKENANIIPSSTTFKLPVRSKSGYAILVHGSIAPGQNRIQEGKEEHLNTLEYAQTVLEADGKGLLPEDIRIVSADDADPIESLKDAIEKWALSKVLKAPAPIYIVLVNHGEPDQFHMHPDILSPQQLNIMISNLEKALENASDPNAAIADKENIILVFGYCFSGTFIEPLSKGGRILISASAPHERSIRGPGEFQNRQGEYFVYLLFRELSKGSSLLDSFLNSRNFIRQVSSRFDLASNSSKPLFPGEKGQHPLLDDDGDGLGTFDATTAIGDGQRAKNIFLVAPDNSVGTLEIARTNPSRFLERDNLSQLIEMNGLWAELDVNANEVADVFIDIKKPGSQDIEGSQSMQASLVLNRQNNLVNDHPRTTGNRVRFSWLPEPDGAVSSDLFTEPGLHEVFFHAVPNDGSDNPQTSDPAVSFVYRASGSTTLDTFNLLSPDAQAIITYNDKSQNLENAMGIFTWEPSVARDQNGGEVEREKAQIRYIVRLWSSQDRENDGDDTDIDLVLESNPTVANHFLLRPAKVDNGIFWWDVVAVDSEGNFRISTQLRQVEIAKTNAIPGEIFGRLMNQETGDLILDGRVIIPGVKTSVSNEGFYAAFLPSGTYTIRATADGFDDSPLRDVFLGPGDALEYDFRLKKASAGQLRKLKVVSELDGVTNLGSPVDGTGSELNEKEFPDGTVVNWSVTSPWPNQGGHNGIRYRAISATSGTENMTGNRTITITWKKQVFLIINNPESRGNPVGQGWYDTNSNIEWSAGQPEVEIVNQKRFFPSPAGGMVSIGNEVPDQITIRWLLQHFLDVQQIGAGTLNQSSGWKNGDEFVSISATPEPGFKFTGWIGDLEGASETSTNDPSNMLISFLMDRSRHIKALFDFEGGEDPPLKAKLRLSPGWNLVSLPIYPTNPQISQVFQVPGKADQQLFRGSVWYWDQNRFKPTNLLTTKTAYWVYCPGKKMVEVDISGFIDMNTSRVLGQGWQLIGPIADRTFPVVSNLHPSVWEWDDKRFVPADSFQRGKGYWIHLNSVDSIPLGN